MNINIHESIVVTVSLTTDDLNKLKTGSTLKVTGMELDSFRNATDIVIRGVL